jgi:hypothetical protein
MNLKNLIDALVFLAESAVLFCLVMASRFTGFNLNPGSRCVDMATE